MKNRGFYSTEEEKSLSSELLKIGASKEQAEKIDNIEQIVKQAAHIVEKHLLPKINSSKINNSVSNMNGFLALLEYTKNRLRLWKFVDKHEKFDSQKANEIIETLTNNGNSIYINFVKNMDIELN